MSDPIEILAERPSLPAVFLRSVRPGRGARPASLPTTRLRHELRADRDDLIAYARICGFSVDDVLPHTYPHVLGFPLQAELMSRGDFPVPMMGLVHLENEITARRALDVAEPLTITVHAEGLRPHPKGRLVDLVTTVEVEGESVWLGRSTYLSRGEGTAGADTLVGRPAFPGGTASARWRVPSDIGRRYGRISGDRNPIHLHPWTAKAMGFPTTIAHGMWTYARTVAALGPRAQGARTSHVWFGKPVLLPASVDLVVDGSEGSFVAGLRSSRRPDVEHLVLTLGPNS